MDLYKSGRMMKHVGVYSGRRVILLMPDASDLNFVYLIEAERLPHSLEDIVVREVESNQAQQSSAIWFADALMGLEYERVNMVKFLFETAGATVRTDYRSVLMVPQPGTQVKLSDVYSSMIAADRRLAEAALIWKANNADTAPKTEEFTTVAQHNDGVDASENSKAIAKNLLVQANMLQADADAKFAEAYSYDPSLRPALKNVEAEPTSKWFDDVSGKSYKTEAALKAAISRRENAKAEQN